MTGGCCLRISDFFDVKVHDRAQIIIGVAEDVLAVVDGRDLREIVRVQPEVEYIGVLSDALGMDGFVDDVIRQFTFLQLKTDPG